LNGLKGRQRRDHIRTLRMTSQGHLSRQDEDTVKLIPLSEPVFYSVEIALTVFACAQLDCVEYEQKHTDDYWSSARCGSQFGIRGVLDVSVPAHGDSDSAAVSDEYSKLLQHTNSNHYRHQYGNQRRGHH